MFDFVTVEALYAAYMPFLTKGGVFIPTKEAFELEEEVELNVRLVQDPERQLVQGKVVWITPSGAQGGKPAGIGVQFTSKDDKSLRARIETHLAGKLNSSESTNTM